MSKDPQSEINRLLDCHRRSASPFVILGITEIGDCELADVNKTFRKVALLLHPDKCDLPNASDAFHIAEKAHKMLSNESVLTRLKVAHQRQQERATSTALPSVGPSSSAQQQQELKLPAEPAFGSLSQLAPTGTSTDAQKMSEIRRVLGCKPMDYFIILDVHPSTCTPDDIKKRYRLMASQLHPDKCQLNTQVTEVFKRFDTAYKELSDEKKFVRYKKGYEQQRESAIRAAQARHRQQANVSAAGGGGGGGAYSNMSPEERREQLKRDLLREQQLQAARLGDEAIRKRQKVEKEKADQEELSAELERQRQEWRDLKLF